MKRDVYESQSLATLLQCLRRQHQDAQAGAAHIRNFRQIELYGSSGTLSRAQQRFLKLRSRIAIYWPYGMQNDRRFQTLQRDFQFLHLVTLLIIKLCFLKDRLKKIQKLPLVAFNSPRFELLRDR